MRAHRDPAPGSGTGLDSKRALLARHPYRFLTLDVANGAPALPEPLAAMVVASEPGLEDIFLELASPEHDRQ